MKCFQDDVMSAQVSFFVKVRENISLVLHQLRNLLIQSYETLLTLIHLFHNNIIVEQCALKNVNNCLYTNFTLT